MIFVLLLTLTAASPSGTVAGSDLEGLVAAERAFDRAAAERGVRAAFLEFLAEDSVVFRPVPLDGRRWFTDNPDLPGTLTWHPGFAEIAAAGDLGYTIGPWTFRPPTGPEGNGPPEQHGHYLSIWRFESDGVWRVALDLGVTHEEGPEEKLERRESSTVPESRESLLALRRSLRAADIAVSDAVGEKGMAGALAGAATADVRVLRNGSLPRVGVEALREAEANSPPESWRPSGGDLSSSGDLGYTYGKTFRQEGKRAVPARTYARIWRRGEDGAWRIAVDLTIPLPPPPPPPRD
jgi:ketosteroid isomerase-like protein